MPILREKLILQQPDDNRDPQDVEKVRQSDIRKLLFCRGEANGLGHQGNSAPNLSFVYFSFPNQLLIS